MFPELVFTLHQPLSCSKRNRLHSFWNFSADPLLLVRQTRQSLANCRGVQVQGLVWLELVELHRTAPKQPNGPEIIDTLWKFVKFVFTDSWKNQKILCKARSCSILINLKLNGQQFSACSWINGQCFKRYCQTCSKGLCYLWEMFFCI